MKYIIIGLGNFGLSLGKQLCQQGHEVIGIDSRESITEEYKDILTTTVCLNSTEETALRSQPIQEADAIIVAIGEDWASSVQTTAILKEMGAKRIIGRSLSALHTKILKGLEIEEIINPEEEAALIISNHIISKNVKQTLSLTDEYSINEIVIPTMFVGQTTEDIDLKKDFDLNLIAVMRQRLTKTAFGVSNVEWEIWNDFASPYTFSSNDHIVVHGHKKQISKLLQIIK